MDKIAAIRIADEYYATGRLAYEKNEYQKAVQFADSAMELYSYFDEKYKICKTLDLKGKILGRNGNETASLEKYLEGLEIAEQNNFCDLLVMFYNNIGFRYEVIQQFDKAIIYYTIANSYFSKLDKKNYKKINELGIELSFNFFDIYLQKKQMKLVKKYYKDIKFYLSNLENKKKKYIYSNALIIREGLLAWFYKDYKKMECTIEKVMSLLKQNFFDDYLWFEYPLLVDFLLVSEYYKECKEVITHYLKEAYCKNDIQAKLFATNLQMKLFKKQNKSNEYKEACVTYVELMENKNNLDKIEKGFALDSKISIRKIDAARKRAEELLGIDNLTKAKNRYSFNKEIKRYILDAIENNQKIILGILDIDSFREINHNYGHVGGDKILITVANKIKDSLKKNGIVYRFGGDEFIVLCKGIDVSGMEEIATSIREELKKIPTSISQGYISFLPKKEDKIEDMISKADKFLYEVKTNGKDDFKIKNIDCIL